MPVFHHIASEEAFIARLDAARAGKSRELGELFDLYRDSMMRTAAAQVARDLAPKFGPSDVVQETFYRASKDFKTFRGSTESEFRQWLEKIFERCVAGMCRNWRSRKIRAISREVAMEKVTEDDLFPIAMRSAERSELAKYDNAAKVRAVGIAMRKSLTEEQRLVIRLRIFEKKSFPDIGRVLNKSAEAVRKIWGRAVQILAREVPQDGGE